MSPVMNCDETEPSTSTSPPRIGPRTSKGRNPPLSRTRTPSVRSGPVIISIGRRSSVPSPSMVIGVPQSEAMGVNRRVERPDSPTRSVCPCGRSPPSIESVSSPIRVTRAPSVSMHCNAERVSLQNSMLRSTEVSSQRSDAAKARCA